MCLKHIVCLKYPPMITGSMCTYLLSAVAIMTTSFCLKLLLSPLMRWPKNQHITKPTKCYQTSDEQSVWLCSLLAYYCIRYS